MAEDKDILDKIKVHHRKKGFVCFDAETLRQASAEIKALRETRDQLMKLMRHYKERLDSAIEC